MYKTIDLGSWNGPGFDLPVHMIKVSSRGLIGNDRADFLKVASHVFADHIDGMKFAADEIPIHLNAIGAFEGYGANRNGDGFTEYTCRTCHPRFVKDAYYFANHKNDDPTQRYGTVKLSAYNDPMRRIELLLMGNGSKQAADRHGGLVMKSATIGKLQRGEMVPFSMACKVAYDVCCNCFNKAANRSQYCTEDTCISPTGRRGFGCKTGLSKVASDGFIQYVDNPDARFIDISEVIRPADRTAWGGTADYMAKAAADRGYIPGGAELAEQWAKAGASFELLGPEATIFNRAVAAQMKLARELAEVERQFESNQTERDQAWARALTPRKLAADFSELGEPGTMKMAEGLAALAGQSIAVPLEAFLGLVAGGDREKLAEYSETVPRHLPGIYQRLVGDANLQQLISTSKFQPATKLASREQRDWACKLASDLSYSDGHVQERVFRSAITSRAPAITAASAVLKTASAADESEQIARQYAICKLACLSQMLELGTENPTQLKRKAVLQHYVS